MRNEKRYSPNSFKKVKGNIRVELGALTSLRLGWFNRHFATLHSGFYLFFRIKAGMERSEMTVSV